MDPMKIVDAAPDVMKLLTLFKSLVDATHDTYTGSQDIWNVVGSMGYLSKNKWWYVALRYTGLLIEAQAFRMLQHSIEKQPYYKEEYFWCGLYAQLENAWEIGDPTVKTQVIDQTNHSSREIAIFTCQSLDSTGCCYTWSGSLDRSHRGKTALF